MSGASNAMINLRQLASTVSSVGRKDQRCFRKSRYSVDVGASSDVDRNAPGSELLGCAARSAIGCRPLSHGSIDDVFKNHRPIRRVDDTLRQRTRTVVATRKHNSLVARRCCASSQRWVLIIDLSAAERRRHLSVFPSMPRRFQTAPRIRLRMGSPKPS